jgi:hypothetical protein
MKFTFLSFFVLFILIVDAQTVFIQDNWNRELERVVTYYQDTTSLYFTGVKPVNRQDVPFSHFAGEPKDSVKYYWGLSRILFRDHLVAFQDKDLKLFIDPLLQIESYQSTDRNSEDSKYNHYTNSRGLWMSGSIGNSISFHTSFLESQSMFPSYMRYISDSLEVIPGMGRYKTFHNIRGYDYAFSNSQVNVEPWKFLRFSLGYGKRFIGHGYRSLLLSDAAMNYPYFQVQFQQKKWRYSSTWSALQEQIRLNTSATNEALFQRKIGSMNVFSFCPNNKWEFNITESHIYSYWMDSTKTKLPFSAMTPLPLLQTLHSKKITSWIGIDLQFRVSKNWNLYGQFLYSLQPKPADILSSSIPSSTSYQIGSLFSSIVTKNLDLRVEYNLIGKYAYSSPNLNSSFSQQNQSLGHASGQDLNEWMVRLDYKIKRILLHASYIQTQQSIGNSGDVFSQSTSSFFGPRSLQHSQFQVGYLINPKTHMACWIKYINHHDARVSASPNSNTLPMYNNAQLFTIGIQTDVWGQYWDF